VGGKLRDDAQTFLGSDAEGGRLAQTPAMRELEVMPCRLIASATCVGEREILNPILWARRGFIERGACEVDDFPDRNPPSPENLGRSERCGAQKRLSTMHDVRR
jgi:hypothetical protein